jgi:ELWxxDGT repeat protein
MVKNINPSGDSDPDYLVALGSTLYFRANDGTDGTELWKSDGTSAGTVMVKDIYPSGSSYPGDFAAIGSTIYFQADDGTNGYELWKSNGTTAGTVMVKNINPSADSYPNGLTVLGSTLYFEANNGTDGYELWKSDGTTAGTVMVKNIDTASNSGNIRAITLHGNLLYFQAEDDGVYGEEMYLSDGTEAGTMRIPAPSETDYVNCDCYDNPVVSTSIGVFFTYYDSTVGYELGFIADRLPETNTNSSALTLALLALSGALAAGAVIARRTELRAN